MKLEFGGLLRRLFFGGVRLLPIEQALMTAMVEALPPPLQHAVQQQLDAYNLVQREADGRALNFYRMVGRKASRDGIPPLPIQRGDVKLLRLTFTLAEHDASAQRAVGHGDVEEQAMRQADTTPTRDRARCMPPSMPLCMPSTSICFASPSATIYDSFAIKMNWWYLR